MIIIIITYYYNPSIIIIISGHEGLETVTTRKDQNITLYLN